MHLFRFGLVFVPLGLTIGYIAAKSENQIPWLIAAVSFVIVAGFAAADETQGFAKLLRRLVLLWLLVIAMTGGYLIFAPQF